MSTLTHTGTIPYFDPLSAEFQADPHPILAQMRAVSEVARSDYGYHLLTYEACNALLRDKRFHQGSARIAEASGLTAGGFYDQFSTSMTASVGEDHARLRRLVSPYFSQKSLTALTGYVRDLTTRLASEAEAGQRPIEFFSLIANVIPAAFFCRMIGAPEEDAGHVAWLSEEILTVFNMNPVNVPRIEAAYEKIHAYVLALLEKRRGETGGDDMLTALLQAEEDGSTLTTREMVSLVITTLEASTDNTSNQLAFAMLLLAEHPSAWRDLRADPSLADRVLEESMRIQPRIVHAQRSADSDVEFRGLHIPARSLIFASVASAHRDPAAYDDPDTFDIHRSNPKATLNFGAGPHYCIGAPLVRLQLTEALNVLAARWETVRVAGSASTRYGLGVADVDALPLEVTLA
jgi:cytochrome P450